jgi:hypothetical protein
MTTAPRFTLRLRARAEHAPPYTGFHEKSPAGLWYAKNASTFEGLALEFEDPHAGLGGLGASSAQFALLYVAELFLRDGKLDSSHLQWDKVLSDYRSVAWTGEGEPPSGADVVAQLCGGLTYYDGVTFKAQVYEWPFQSSGIVLLHTGQKLATHEYLKAELDVPEALREIVQKAERALRDGSFPLFAEAFIQYGLALAEKGWVAPQSLEIIAALRKAELPGVNVVATKGCGAMGADIVAVLVQTLPEANAGRALELWLKDQPRLSAVRVVGTTTDIDAGLKVTGP